MIDAGVEAQIRCLIEDAYRVCARTADNFGAREAADAIRRSAERVVYTRSKDGLRLEVQFASASPSARTSRTTPEGK